MPHSSNEHRAILRTIARRAMQQRGLLADFTSAVGAQVRQIAASSAGPVESGVDRLDIRDLTNLLWASIDNDDSRDLDQLTVAEVRPDGTTVIRVAVADVDALVPQGSAIDVHARHNTTSVYTAGGVFPLLPEALSTDLTSLNLNEVRLAVVVDMQVADSGEIQRGDLYRARVRNHAQLTYHGVAAWLDGLARRRQRWRPYPDWRPTCASRIRSRSVCDSCATCRAR